MKVKLEYEDTFDAAHYLPYYKGKCRSMHGHTWKVKVGVIGETLEGGPNIGMVVDFSKIKEIIRAFDHVELNDHITNPTAELIAKVLYVAISKMLGEVNTTAKVNFVEIWESSKAVARVEVE